MTQKNKDRQHNDYDHKFKEVLRTAQPFGIELPVSSQDGFLGSPYGLRSSTRACSTGVTSGRPNPTK